jgi:ParB family transcriptional regulator, chromosome partitioning protein
VSTPSQSNLGKRKLLKDSPFQRLTQRTTDTGEQAMREAREIDITKIDTNPRQPRRFFDPEKLNELAQDIAARGILQPPIVRPIPDTDRYEIVVGERRYQAAKQVGLERIPVIVREDLNDKEAEITSLVENIQREDLTLEDEVRYFKMLQAKYDYSIREIADEVAHKSHTYVEVRLKLADFPDLLTAVQTNKIKMSEAIQFMRQGLDRKAILERLENLKASLEKSQTVILNDTSLEKSQSSTAKKTPPQPYEIDQRLAQPFLKIRREIQVVAKKLDGVELTEKTALLESLALLEQEINDLRRRLMGDLN